VCLTRLTSYIVMAEDAAEGRFSRVGSSLHPSPGTRVLVTGATGFIGGAVAARLLGLGCTVVGLSRDEHRARLLAKLGYQPALGEIGNVQSLSRACTGCEIAIHCAALVGPGHPPREYARVIVEGTQNALSAAARAGVRRFVYVSSVAAYRRPRLWPRRGVEVIDEDSPLGQAGEPYGESKARAEALCRSFYNRGELNIAVVRPTLVYGPNDRGFLPFLIQALRRRKIRLIDGGTAPVSLVHVSDVAEAILRAAVAERAEGRAYNLDGPDRLTWHAFVAKLTRELGMREPQSVPWPIAWALGAACEVGAAARLISEPPLSRAVVRFFVAQRRFSTARAEYELGHRSRVSLEDALPASLVGLA